MREKEKRREGEDKIFLSFSEKSSPEFLSVEEILEGKTERAKEWLKGAKEVIIKRYPEAGIILKRGDRKWK